MKYLSLLLVVLMFSCSNEVLEGMEQIQSTTSVYEFTAQVDGDEYNWPIDGETMVFANIAGSINANKHLNIGTYANPEDGRYFTISIPVFSPQDLEEVRGNIENMSRIVVAIPGVLDVANTFTDFDVEILEYSEIIEDENGEQYFDLSLEFELPQPGIKGSITTKVYAAR